MFEIVDSHEPGYVCLKLSCILRKTGEDRYVVEQLEQVENNGLYLAGAPSFSSSTYEEAMRTLIQRHFNEELVNIHLTQSLLTHAVDIHGPAIKCENRKFGEFYKPTSYFLSNIDYVACVFCPSWPPLAADWPLRDRVHGWPDQTTVDSVVSNACDVVGAVHPSCRQDEWMSEYEWRLSFSRAEVTLLNSWTPVQQIVYHMLRVILKRELFPKTNNNDANVPKLSNYHIKTLMLWECEQNTPGWWSTESSVVKLCSRLLLKLSVLVAGKRCEHYFIKSCNLLDWFADSSCQMICNILISIADVPVLLSWFIENYILKCAALCPPIVSVMFEDISSREKLTRAMYGVIDWKLSTQSRELYTEYYDSEKMILAWLLLHRIDKIIEKEMLTGKLHNFDPKLQNYFVGVASLQVAFTTSIHSLNEKHLEVLWTLFNPCSSAICDTGGDEDVILMSVRKAIKLATLSTVRSNALEMLHNEMAKAYLHKIIAHGQEFTYSFVHVLLAILYYKSGHYLTAIAHCSQIPNQRSRCNLCNIGADHLPQIDKNVDLVFGLIVIYQHVRLKALSQDMQLQQKCGPALTADLLSHYLYYKGTTGELATRYNQLTKYRQRLSSYELPTLGDILLFRAMITQLDECREMPAAADETSDISSNAPLCMDTSLLVTLLELIALEKLAARRQYMVLELHPQQFPAVNEFDILYAYKCGLFKECLNVCRNHVNTSIRTGCYDNQLFMVALPEFLCLLDGELLSLFGIVRLLHPIPLLFLIQFQEHESISMLTLLLYLMTQCQKKLRSDSLNDALQLIRYVHDNVLTADNKVYFLDRLILKLTYRSLVLFIIDSTSDIYTARSLKYSCVD